MEANIDPVADLLNELEQALPVKRQVNVEGWPRPVWIWRLELAQIIELNKKRKLLSEGDRGRQEWALELLAMCLGDANAPGAFATAQGRNWLRRQPEAVVKLSNEAQVFNELTGPSSDRKKKSEAASDSSTSAEPSESSIPDDSLSD